METLNIKFIGTMPLLMHNGRMSDPCDPMTIALAKITKTRGKTESTHADIRRAEWMGAIYTCPTTGVVGVPSDMALACLIEGSRKSKLGKSASAGILEAKDFYPLTYDGPKGIDALYDDGRFVDTRGVKVQRARVQRTRPIFRAWSLSVSLMVDTDVMEVDQVFSAAEAAGKLVGIGDFRPRFGRFDVVRA
tara:strand:- start:1787 stop:2359 length:573 start_codon:yes stop_codon:yes gene_type:complete